MRGKSSTSLAPLTLLAGCCGCCFVVDVVVVVVVAEDAVVAELCCNLGSTSIGDAFPLPPLLLVLLLLSCFKALVLVTRVV